MKHSSLLLLLVVAGCSAGADPGSDEPESLSQAVGTRFLASGDTYTLRFPGSGSCWNIENADPNAGAFAQLFPCQLAPDTTNEQFVITRVFANSSVFTIKPVNSGRCLQAAQTPTVPGGNQYSVRQWDCSSDWHRVFDEWIVTRRNAAFGDLMWTIKPYANPEHGAVCTSGQGTFPNRLVAGVGTSANAVEIHFLNGDIAL